MPLTHDGLTPSPSSEAVEIPVNHLHEELAGLLESLELAREVAATAVDTSSTSTNYRLRVATDQTPDQTPGQNARVELVMERLDSEAPLVQELNQRYQPGREFSNATCRIHTWSVEDHEIILRSEPDILYFTIN